MVWNIRGLTDDSKLLLKEHCCSFKPLILGLLEPKTDFTKPSLAANVVFSSPQVAIVDCHWQNMDFRLAIIHGSNDPGERRTLWTILLHFAQGNTVFIGDFNAVKGSHERISGVLPPRGACRDFCRFIEDSGFIESPTSGLRFTWSGRRLLPHHVESRLDRALFSTSFANLWGTINTHALPRATSDHSPIVLQCRFAAPPTKRSFKFLNMWTSHPNFLDAVADSWNMGVDVRCPMLSVMLKLKRLKGVLRCWNKSVFGNVDSAIAQTQHDLSDIQATIADLGYNDSRFDAEVSCEAKLNRFLSQKNSLLQQKSRIAWLMDGDKNTSFFHNMLKFRKDKLHIGHLRIGNDIVYDSKLIEQHIIGHFSSLFTNTTSDVVDLAALEANVDLVITEEQNKGLVSIPDDTEITAAVFSLDGNSSPGPDGFSGLFFQNCWSLIKNDVIKAVKSFFLHTYLPVGCNANTLILIPKKDLVESVSDLRPIILANFLFKIISKVLASRLSSVAAASVSPNQFGFISGRSIHDCIAMGSEGFNTMNRINRGSNFACKIDIHKAFDTMRWDFIFAALRAMGYHDQFIRWIECSRGVRQGDPLSPILFGIAEDVLSHIIRNCVTSRHLVPMGFDRVSDFPTHLFYADDVLIFCRASVRNAKKIKHILDFYGELSGQICSQAKSRIFFGRGVSYTMMQGINRVLGFTQGSLPTTYLGVPLFVGRPRASYFMSIKERIVQKFSKWKGLQLSMAGRLCLVNSVIRSSIVHSMMVFRWPRSLLHDLDRSCRNFIWSGSIDKKLTCAVSWGRCCAPKEEGGLGVRSFAVMNRCYMMKMAWKLLKGEDFIFRILRSRYLNSFGLAKASVVGSSFWLSVKPEVDELVENSYALVGNGQHTRFWTDDWLGYKICDKIAIPSFMHEFLHQSVADYFSDGVWHFSANFIECYPEVVVDIITCQLVGEKDGRFWKPSLRGDVTAALAFAQIGHRFPKVIWGSWIWNKVIPVRRSITCWRIIHGRLPTMDKLVRNGLIAPNRCSLCMADAENLDHIFWSCPSVTPIWNEFLTWFHMPHLMACVDINSFLVQTWQVSFCSFIQNFWKLGIANILWCIWSLRNKAIFEDQPFEQRRVLAFAKASFKEVDEAFPKLGHTSNLWSDYLITRSIGVSMRAAPPPNFVSVSWWPPVEDWIKVNTDGAASGAPGDIAAGGVYRDKFCVVRCCFHLKGGKGYAFEAELLAVITAVAIAHSRGWHKLWLEADSLYVVKLLEDRSLAVPWRFYAAWKITLARLNDITFRVSHIFREGNAVADAMANLTQPEGWWPFGIEAIRKLVVADIATHSFSRKVR
ncbi:uncharacterized protein LOC130998068 [Salvia miltiorrhiza]|uniref:uncharacterized protein LOC130998068 n=1 Tax=Salvia miltiorrhiza TaxID=226208 RepID=UPI0025AB8C96|nr:uncharacterized protein LOC130998068 [Salvia miltiorrhiza]